MTKKIGHRGPDWSGIYSNKGALLAHEQLAIVDPASGKQPLLSQDNTLVLAANGEIYNHQELREKFKETYTLKTQSDCEVILAMYQKKGASFIDELNGIFGFAVYDAENDDLEFDSLSGILGVFSVTDSVFMWVLIFI